MLCIMSIRHLAENEIINNKQDTGKVGLEAPIHLNLIHNAEVIDK